MIFPMSKPKYEFRQMLRNTLNGEREPGIEVRVISFVFLPLLFFFSNFLMADESSCYNYK